MTIQKFTRELAIVIESAGKLACAVKADAVLVLLDSATDWERLRELVPPEIKRVLVAADRVDDLADAEKFGLIPIVLNKEDSPLLERLQHALLEAVADELLANHCDVIAVYCGFEINRIDSISIIRLDERMRRFTSRDLQRLEFRACQLIATQQVAKLVPIPKVFVPIGAKEKVWRLFP